MKRMLINATQPEELRVALVDGQQLYDLDIEAKNRTQKKSNIYKAQIVRVEPSLEAAFVDYGAEKHGFLPFRDISPTLLNSPRGNRNRVTNIADSIKSGQEFIVQIDKEERGNKGAALTTLISLAGRYLVLMPNNPRVGGISRQVSDTERSEAKENLVNLNVPQGMGYIIRTAGVDRPLEELRWDLNYLLQLWNAINETATGKTAPFLIYQEGDVIIRALRDYLQRDIEEIWIDDHELHQRAHDFINLVMPHNLQKLHYHNDSTPLFHHYRIESQIEAAYSREINLPSGGSIIIDHTEALTSIDINSAKFTKASDIKETALHTNLEAAKEIPKQLRIRDLGGLFTIDFIDMMSVSHQKKVEQQLRENLHLDRAQTQMGRISRFGLLEMSRQRLRPSLGDSSHIVCPRCQGQGTIRSDESLALGVLRIVEEEAMKDLTGEVVAHLPVSIASFLLNKKRKTLHELEHRYDVTIILIPQIDMITPRYQVERIRVADVVSKGGSKLSDYDTLNGSENTDNGKLTGKTLGKNEVEEPAIKHFVPAKPAPQKSDDNSLSSSPTKENLPSSATSIYAIAQDDVVSSDTKKSAVPNPEKVVQTTAKNNDKSKNFISSWVNSFFGSNDSDQDKDSDKKEKSAVGIEEHRQSSDTDKEQNHNRPVTSTPSQRQDMRQHTKKPVDESRIRNRVTRSASVEPSQRPASSSQRSDVYTPSQSDYGIADTATEKQNLSSHTFEKQGSRGPLSNSQIEALLEQHPRIDDAVVVGYPHDENGRRRGSCACITLAHGGEPDETLYQELLTLLREQGNLKKLPDIRWSPKLPKTRNGKILRASLRRVIHDSLLSTTEQESQGGFDPLPLPPDPLPPPDDEQ